MARPRGRLLRAGSLILALDGRPGAALYVGACTLAFAVAVAAGDRIAAGRSNALAAGATDDRPLASGRADPVPWRPWVAVVLAVVGLVAIAPTIIRVGLPFLAGDITGARSELTGLPVQELRVAFPALALGLLLTTGGRPRPWLVVSYVAIAALLAFDLALASRYLAAELVAILLVGIGLARWRIPIRALVGLGIAGTLLFGSAQILRAYDQAAGRELAFAVERTVNRIVLIQPRTLEALQDVIPREQPYFGGLTWVRRLGPLVGREDIPNIGYWIYPRVFPDQDPPGYLAPGIVGEAWANFGPAGVTLFVLLGIAVERFGAVLARRRRGTGDVIAAATGRRVRRPNACPRRQRPRDPRGPGRGLAAPGRRRPRRSVAGHPDGTHVANLSTFGHRVRDDWFVAIGLVAAIVAVVLLRTALFGWSPVAPDDARYLFVGLSVLAGDGPVTPSGNTFVLRSPVYGLALAAGSTIVGGDPITGARVVTIVLAIVCLCGAMRLGWLLAGPGGAAGTALALLATPIIWRLVASLRIDLPQTAGVIAILLAVWRPTTRRWAVGGVLLGLTVLVKETVAPLALLPLAMLGLEPPRRVAAFTAAYLAAALLTAGWWWVVVWFSAGVVFPLNAIGVIARRDVALDAPGRPAGTGAARPVRVVVARDRHPRPCGARPTPAAGRRRLPGAGSDVRRLAGPERPQLRGAGGPIRRRARRDRGLGRRVVRSVVPATRHCAGRNAERGSYETGPRRVGGCCVRGQCRRRCGRRPTSGRAPVGDRRGRRPCRLASHEYDGWRPGRDDIQGSRVMALRLFGSVQVPSVPAVRVAAAVDLSDYLWIGLRDRQVFGYTRSAWTRALTRHQRPRYLVISSPHPFTPADLEASMTAGSRSGPGAAGSVRGPYGPCPGVLR